MVQILKTHAQQKNTAKLLTTIGVSGGTMKWGGPNKGEEGQFPETQSSEIYVILLADYDYA